MGALRLKSFPQFSKNLNDLHKKPFYDFLIAESFFLIGGHCSLLIAHWLLRETKGLLLTATSLFPK